MTSSHAGPEDSGRPFDLDTFLSDFLWGLNTEATDDPV